MILEDTNVSSPTTEMAGEVDEKPYYLHWQYEAYKTIFLYVSPVLLGVGTVGNVLAIIVLLSREMRASGVNLILTVLAMADLCLLYTSLLRAWVLFLTKGAVDMRAFNIHACRVHMFFTYFSVQLSPMTLALMTVERVVSVCAPLRAREWCSRGNTIKALAGLVVLLAGFDLVLFVSVTFEHSLAGAGQKCFFTDQMTSIWYLIQTFFEAYIPFAIIFIGNGLIIYKLVKAERKRADKMATTNEGATSATNTSVMLVTISFFFLLTNLPFSIWANGHNKHWPTTSPDHALRARSFMAYAITYEMSKMNNSFNFVFYCVFAKTFRTAFASTVLCRKPAAKTSTKMSSISGSGSAKTDPA